MEDLAGTVEVVVFPRDYEKYQRMLRQDDKVFIRGRVSAEDDAPSKLICENVVPFEQTKQRALDPVTSDREYGIHGRRGASV
ncbi:MAG: hypothetical protein ACLRT5_19770 [Lachnospiraceae bacterium]